MKPNILQLGGKTCPPCIVAKLALTELANQGVIDFEYIERDRENYRLVSDQALAIADKRKLDYYKIKKYITPPNLNRDKTKDSYTLGYPRFVPQFFDLNANSYINVRSVNDLIVALATNQYNFKNYSKIDNK